MEHKRTIEVTHNKRNRTEIKGLPTGTMFSFGTPNLWYIKTDKGIVSLDSGTTFTNDQHGSFASEIFESGDLTFSK